MSVTKRVLRIGEVRINKKVAVRQLTIVQSEDTTH